MFGVRGIQNMKLSANVNSVKLLYFAKNLVSYLKTQTSDSTGIDSS